MPDIRARQKPLPPISPPPTSIDIDWVTNGEGIDETQALQTAVLVALGTDALATPSDPLPDQWFDDDRRGWWGDVDANAVWGGWPIGCRLWTMARDKITFAGSRAGSTAAKAVEICNQAIQPFVDLGIATSFTTTAAVVDPSRRIDVNITMYRRIGNQVNLTYSFLWDDIIPIQEIPTNTGN